MQIDLQFDQSVSNASSRWVNSIKEAADFLDKIITDPITVTMDIGDGEVEGQALGQNVLGATIPGGFQVTYSQLVSALKANPTSQLDMEFLNTLPSSDPGNGGSYFVATAEAKALGLAAPDLTEVDAYVGFSDGSSIPLYYDPNRVGVPSNSADLIGVALHELTHGLGRALAPDAQAAMNLMTFGANGQRDLNNTDARYVSYDGGRTNIANLDISSDPSDLAQGSPTKDPFDAYQAPGVDSVWTNTDTAMMEMLGFHVNIPSAAQSLASSLGNVKLAPADFALSASSTVNQSALGGHSPDESLARGHAFAMTQTEHGHMTNWMSTVHSHQV